MKRAALLLIILMMAVTLAGCDAFREGFEEGLSAPEETMEDKETEGESEEK